MRLSEAKRGENGAAAYRMKVGQIHIVYRGLVPRSAMPEAAFVRGINYLNVLTRQRSLPLSQGIPQPASPAAFQQAD